MRWNDVKGALARLDALLSDNVYDHGRHLAGLGDPKDQTVAATPMAEANERAVSSPSGWRSLVQGDRVSKAGAKPDAARSTLAHDRRRSAMANELRALSHSKP